jgi:GTP:adenosylcobinamide-phosphate guanylyltransferase
MVHAAAGQLDVIVTAGDRGASRPVLQTNKVYLPIVGVPVINYVLSAVERARVTARIFVVGDKARLEAALSIANNPFQGRCPITLIEQSHSLYDNVWKAFLYTLPGYEPGMDWHRYAESAADKAVLVMPGDIPLATPAEIDAFVAHCDLRRFDYFLGLTPESALEPYAPQPDRPGIRMAHFPLRDVKVRQNNLHLVKPLRITNRHYIQRVYDHRYQKRWPDILKLCWQIITLPDVSLRCLWAFVCLHVARLIIRLGWEKAPWFRPLFLDLSMLASCISQALQTRLTMVTTYYGGCTLDVDNAEHYEAICVNFTRWLAHQERLAQELKD